MQHRSIVFHLRFQNLKTILYLPVPQYLDKKCIASQIYGLLLPLFCANFNCDKWVSCVIYLTTTSI